MSRLGAPLSLISRLPTVMRTIAHLRPRQARAQLRHALFGLPSPKVAFGSSPILAIERPHTPFLAPPAHVKRLDEERIEMIGTAIEIDLPIDWESDAGGPLFAYHLHQHEALRLPEFSPRARAAILCDWIQNHPTGVGWNPHPISLRLLCWGKILLTPGFLELESEARDDLLRSMASQAQTLASGLEIRLQANHLLSNQIAVVFAGLLLDGSASPAWRNLASDLLAELDSQIRPDGGHEERSPMYHSLLLENLLDLLNLCRSDPARVPMGLEAGLCETLERMLSALESLTHPDGEIALFADSAFGIAAKPKALADYAARLGLSRSADALTSAANSTGTDASTGSRLLPQTGYLRLHNGSFDLIASVGGPSPRHQPGHAHCDALSFELSVAGHRLVTDTGLFEYRPGRRRDLARCTDSHATIGFDGTEQAEVWSAHRVGGRPSVELTAWNESGSAEATCCGWSRGAPLHRRFFSLEPSLATIVDVVEGSFGHARSILPIDPTWRVVLDSGHARATRESASGEASIVEIELAECFEWLLERRFYYPTFGSEVERFVLVGTATGPSLAPGPTTTRFRHVG